MQKYAVHTRHDKGEITIYVVASSEDAAISMVMQAERCPRRSILWVKTEVQIQEEKMTTITVEDMVSREVIYCVSGLVCDLATLAGHCGQTMANETNLDPEEIQEMLQQPDYEAAADEHIDNMDRDELIETLDDEGIEDERDSAEVAEAAIIAFAGLLEAGDVDPMDGDTFEDLLDQWPGVNDSTLRAKLKEYLNDQGDGYKDFVESNRIDYEYIDVYEHWLVTDWLARKLQERGQLVFELSNLTIWGRTCTGQAISMDWVIGEIHRELVSK